MELTFNDISLYCTVVFPFLYRIGSEIEWWRDLVFRWLVGVGGGGGSLR